MTREALDESTAIGRPRPEGISGSNPNSSSRRAALDPGYSGRRASRSDGGGLTNRDRRGSAGPANSFST